MFLKTHGTQAQRVRIGKTSLPHECFHHRNAEAVSEPAQSLARAPPRYPVTGEDNGISGLQNDFRCPFDLLVQRFGRKSLLRQKWIEARGRLRFRDILGKVKMSSTRLFRLG